MARQLRIEFPGLFTTSAQEAMNAKPYLKVNVAVEESSRRSVHILYIGESGVSQTTRRVSDKLKNDKKLTRKINRIKNKLKLCSV